MSAVRRQLRLCLAPGQSCAGGVPPAPGRLVPVPDPRLCLARRAEVELFD